MALFNLARMTVSSSGTGTITLNSAVSGFLTFDLSGCSTASAGQAVTYAINDTTQSEIGSGTYTSSALSLTRGSSTTGLKSTNGNSPINMSNSAQVVITPQAAGIFGRVVVQAFTASTTYFPTTGLIGAMVETLGAGGGGGGANCTTATQAYAGGGGGAGSYSRKYLLSSAIGTSQVVTVGSGGNGGAAGANNGNNGTGTSFGALCTSNGGSGGAAGVSSAPPFGGAGGGAGTGDIAGVGEGGFSGAFVTIAGVNNLSGAGGATQWGGGGLGVFANASLTNGSSGTGYGSGGSGGNVNQASANAAGGNGAAGFVVVTEYCNL